MIVAKLFVRTALSDFYEAEFLKYPDNLRRFEDWDLAHYYATATFWTLTNSDSSFSSPSSSNIEITSRRFS